MPPPNSVRFSAFSTRTNFEHSQHTSIPPTSESISHQETAHDDNVNFLRSSPALSNPLPPSLSRQRRHRYSNLPSEAARMEVDDPNPNQRTSAEIHRRIPIIRNEEGSTTMPNYEGQVPNSRSLYGWAPGSDDDDGVAREESEDDQVQPFPHALSTPSAPTRPPRHQIPSPAQLTPQDYGALSSSNRARILSSAMASSQYARRQPRLVRTRTLEYYPPDRYAGSTDPSQEADNEHTATSTSRVYRHRPSMRADSQQTTHSDLHARAVTHRQLNSNTCANKILKETINYLDRLRYSNSLEESILVAADSRLPFPMDEKSWQDTDFILYTPGIAPPASCSWLRSGMAFSGFQRAASAASSVLSRRVSNPHTSNEPVIVNGSESNPRISLSTSTGRRSLVNSRDENWPVKVTIHHINHEEMTLSGTMEAYNIPDKSSSIQDAHIVTFLEGEIIDFNKHTLETKNFKADADIDTKYWRELEPFKELTDTDMAQNLVSRKWITEVLSKGWILMRWKGKQTIIPMPFKG